MMIIYDLDAKQLGEYIVKQRELLGISQKKLAKLMNIKQVRLAKAEAGLLTLTFFEKDILIKMLNGDSNGDNS